MEDREEKARLLLTGSVLFRDAPAEAAQAALEDPRCTVKRATRGSVIYTPESFQRCLGLVVEGRVQVSKGTLLMSVLEPGELFGAAALFQDGGAYATTLTALTACRLLFLPQELVEELMARFPAVGRGYVRYLSGRIRFLSGKIDALTAGSAERKLARYLLARRTGETAVLDCPAAALARRLGVSRASLYRALDLLTAEGAIRRAGRQIVILDQERLEDA